MLSLLFSFLKILVSNLELPSILESEEKVEREEGERKGREQSAGDTTRKQGKEDLALNN